jgi:hypothetical protein
MAESDVYLDVLAPSFDDENYFGVLKIITCVPYKIVFECPILRHPLEIL